MDAKKTKLRWALEIKGYILLKHRVRQEILDALMEAEVFPW